VDNIIEFGDSEKDENPGKQKRFWSYIQSLRKDTSGVSSLKENGKMHADPKDRSGPQALLGLIFSSILNTPSSEMLISGTDGMELPAGFGIIVLVSSLVNTDSYCLLSMAALSFGSACHIICICNILSLLMFIYVPEKTS
jgi:hypothetical protein